jgi:hypothetical protein
LEAVETLKKLLFSRAEFVQLDGNRVSCDRDLD